MQRAGQTVFPPLPTVGSRVWTDHGYQDHGPAEGPKADIAPEQGGTIVATEQPHPTIDSLLYTVHWDNGQTSKHYFKTLFCIGRFRTRSEFQKAIKITGPAEVTLGPQGGFRSATVQLEYDGVILEAEVTSRGLWLGCLEALVTKSGARVVEKRLAPATRPRRPRKRG